MESEQDIRQGYTCPCCKQFCKMYRRSMNANMALAAILMFKHAKGKFVHVEELIRKHGHKRSGDFSYLRHYDILEAFQGKREDGSSRNGHYRLTQKGVDFVLGNIAVPKFFFIYNNSLQGFEEPAVTIVDALGRKFDYRSLMEEVLIVRRKPQSNGQQNLFSL